jgi:hypothetical protein
MLFVCVLQGGASLTGLYVLCWLSFVFAAPKPHRTVLEVPPWEREEGLDGAVHSQPPSQPQQQQPSQQPPSQQQLETQPDSSDQAQQQLPSNQPLQVSSLN